MEAPSAGTFHALRRARSSFSPTLQETLPESCEHTKREQETMIPGHRGTELPPNPSQRSLCWGARSYRLFSVTADPRQHPATSEQAVLSLGDTQQGRPGCCPRAFEKTETPSHNLAPPSAGKVPLCPTIHSLLPAEAARPPAAPSSRPQPPGSAPQGPGPQHVGAIPGPTNAAGLCGCQAEDYSRRLGSTQISKRYGNILQSGIYDKYNIYVSSAFFSKLAGIYLGLHRYR